MKARVRISPGLLYQALKYLRIGRPFATKLMRIAIKLRVSRVSLQNVRTLGFVLLRFAVSLMIVISAWLDLTPIVGLQPSQKVMC